MQDKEDGHGSLSSMEGSPVSGSPGDQSPIHPAIQKISFPSFTPLPPHVIQNFFPLSPAFPTWKEGSPPQGRNAYFSSIIVSERAMFSHRSKVGAEEGSGGDQNKAVSYISGGDIVKTREHSKENNFTLGYSNYVSG